MKVFGKIPSWVRVVMAVITAVSVLTPVVLKSRLHEKMLDLVPDFNRRSDLDEGLSRKVLLFQDATGHPVDVEKVTFTDRYNTTFYPEDGCLFVSRKFCGCGFIAKINSRSQLLSTNLTRDDKAHVIIVPTLEAKVTVDNLNTNSTHVP